MLQLLTNNRSPYGKRVLLSAEEIEVPLEVYSTEPNSNNVFEYNPLGKIPVLYNPETKSSLAGSTYIVRYLHLITPGSSLVPESPENLMRDSCLESVSEGIIEAILLLVYEEKFRHDSNRPSSDWCNHQKIKIIRGLDWLSSQTPRIEISSNFGSTGGQVAVVVAVGYAWMKSEFFNLPIPPALQDWFKRYAAKKPHTQVYFPELLDQ